jgi:cytochrome c biogenesis protein CcdA
MSIQTSTELPGESSRRKRLVPTFYIVLGVVLLLALIGLLIWGVIWLAQNQADIVQVLRDIFIIALSLTSCLFGIVLIIMLIMMVRLVNMIEFEIKPILQKTDETVGMVRGTTVFMSQHVVRPVTKASSYFAGIRSGFRALFGDPSKNLSD